MQMQSIQDQVFLFNCFMGKILSSMSPLVLDDLIIKIAVVHDLEHRVSTPVPEHEHPMYELAWLRFGSMIYEIDNVRVENTVDNLQMVLIPPTTLHRRFSVEPLSVIRSIELQFQANSPAGIHRLAALPELIKKKGFVLQPSETVRVLLKQLDICVENGTFVDQKLAENLLCCILLNLFRDFFISPAEPEKLWNPQLTSRQELVKYIQMLLEDRINGITGTRDFITLAGVGERQFNRIFKAETGMSFHNYLIARRLAHAEHMLRQGTSVNDVAAALGFCSASYFISFFRKHRGMTPANFYKMLCTKEN